MVNKNIGNFTWKDIDYLLADHPSFGASWISSFDERLAPIVNDKVGGEWVDFANAPRVTEAKIAIFNAALDEYRNTQKYPVEIIGPLTFDGWSQVIGYSEELERIYEYTEDDFIRLAESQTTIDGLNKILGIRLPWELDSKGLFALASLAQISLSNAYNKYNQHEYTYTTADFDREAPKPKSLNIAFDSFFLHKVVTNSFEDRTPIVFDSYIEYTVAGTREVSLYLAADSYITYTLAGGLNSGAAEPIMGFDSYIIYNVAGGIVTPPGGDQDAVGTLAFDSYITYTVVGGIIDDVINDTQATIGFDSYVILENKTLVEKELTVAFDSWISSTVVGVVGP